jgi:cysteine-rich repeat protein
MPPQGTAAYPAEVEPNNIPSEANPLQAGTKGFTASIWPLGDVDDFSFKVTVGGSSVTVKTSDGMGGCPAGAHTYVRITDSMSNVLVSDDGTSGCASFNASNAPSLVGLPVGTYYVHIEDPDLAIIPFYIVDIDVQAPNCGDGVVQVSAGEQCDHGGTNGTPGDGCSATCQILSGSYVNETEPNNTQATGNSVDGHAGAVGELNPAGDVDFYTVHVNVAGSSITAQIGDGFGGCPLGFDSQLTLFSPSMTKLVSDQSSGVPPCSKIAPAQYAAAANLPVGKYTLKVERLSGTIQPYYVLQVTVAPPGCGDGVIEAGEQCDPGQVMNPLCSATCQFTSDYIPETEPNDTQALANPLGTHKGFIGAIKPVGDLDYFSFTVPGPNSLVTLQTSDGIGGCPPNFDSVLRFYDPNGNQLVIDDNGAGVGLCSKISPAQYPQALNLAAGTYEARVEFKGNNTAYPQYVLTINVGQPGCGDGVVEAGEQCDDGPNNGTPGDGCSATCTTLAPWEIEPNTDTAHATPQWPGFSTWKASINPVGDHDYFTFTTTSTATVTLTTHDVDTPTVCTSDTVLYLLDHTGTQIGFDDDSGPGPGDPSAGQCSQIVMPGVQAGTYYAWVQRFSDTKVIPKYQLDLMVQ